MSDKTTILNNLKRQIKQRYEMPVIKLDAIGYEDKTARFIEISEAVGGHAIELKEGDDMNEVIRALFPDTKTILSNLPQITIATGDPDQITDARQLNGTDLSIVKGELGVAENGCIWIPQNVKERALYFISEYLVIVLEKKTLVNTMHEAYERIQFNDKGYGLFISGPSKTADIEQALVIGAHGPKGLTVLLV